MEPIVVWQAPSGAGPNAWKVIIVLEELSLPYNIAWIPYSDTKSEPFISLNPNGRVPAMKDPNTGVVLFESGAIMEYLVDRYDREEKLTYSEARLHDRYLVKSWLHFQMSGQGPYFGQKMWFTFFHPESNLTSVIDRYGTEAKRVLGVIESHLAKQKKALSAPSFQEPLWLVGDKCTYADLAFVPWDLLVLTRMFPEGGFDAEKEFPLFYQWHLDVTSRPAVKKTIDMRRDFMDTLEDSSKGILDRQGSKREGYNARDGRG